MMMATAILMVIPTTKTNTVKGTMTPTTMAMATMISSMCLSSLERSPGRKHTDWWTVDITQLMAMATKVVITTVSRMVTTAIRITTEAMAIRAMAAVDAGVIPRMSPRPSVISP